jgi:pyruvate,water dikinase
MSGPSLLVNLSVPQRAAAAAGPELGAEGVGLMRAEFLVFQTGKHPGLLQEQGELQPLLADGMRQVAQAFHPRRVLYRSLDQRTNDLRALEGAEGREPHEENPALGCRGVFRSMRFPEIFLAELAALRQVRSEGFSSLQLMLPFVRWADEVAWAREQCTQQGLLVQDGFELWMMVETPAAVLRAEDFRGMVDGVSIGSNDLTQFILAIDRDNEVFADVNLDRDPAALAAIEWAIRSFQRLGVPVGICGDAPSRSEHVLQSLVSWGVDSISLSPDRLQATQVLLSQLSTPAT